MRMIAVIGILIAIGAGIFLFNKEVSPADSPTTSPASSRSPISSSNPNREDIEIIAENLDIPWEVAFLPEGDILVTERPGTLLRIGEDRQAIPVSGVRHTGEGGLMGLALHPEFTNNNWVYLYLTSDQNGRITNRVERYVLNGSTLSDRTVIIDGVPGSAVHDGGRIEFGPDGYLYIGTGDAGNENSAQDTDSLAGKILRLNDDGSIPADNPFNNAVYSYGHRNVQGLAWDNQGRLWATEHGPSGSQTGNDELNLIERGNNYGWPVIRGTQERNGMVRPIFESGRNETWAPGDVEFLNEKLYFVGLRGGTLYEFDTETNELIKHLENEYGRLRAVRLGPDEGLYITTSNTDGRGQIREGDDKLIKINPEILQ